MSKFAKVRKQGKKEVVRGGGSRRESIRALRERLKATTSAVESGPLDCGRVPLGKKKRVDDLLYEQQMSADRECQVSAVPKADCV